MTHSESRHVCPRCGAEFVRRSTFHERETPPVPGEPLYGLDVERTALCVECRLRAAAR